MDILRLQTYWKQKEAFRQKPIMMRRLMKHPWNRGCVAKTRSKKEVDISSSLGGRAATQEEQ
jgi:hypothetical protein